MYGTKVPTAAQMDEAAIEVAERVAKAVTSAPKADRPLVFERLQTEWQVRMTWLQSQQQLVIASWIWRKAMQLIQSRFGTPKKEPKTWVS